MQAKEACKWPTRCTPVALGYKGSEWGSKLGCQDLEMQYLGEKVWGWGLGTFDLAGCNGPCQHVGLGRHVSFAVPIVLLYCATANFTNFLYCATALLLTSLICQLSEVYTIRRTCSLNILQMTTSIIKQSTNTGAQLLDFFCSSVPVVFCETP